jgi:hypothetical protein
MLNAYSKTKIVHISYKSVTAAMTDVSAGAVAFSFFGATPMPMVRPANRQHAGAVGTVHCARKRQVQ